MATYLGYAEETLLERKAQHTAIEISQQPEIWMDVIKCLEDKKSEIETFINERLANKRLRIILTGAGSSAFVGKCAQVYLNKVLDQQVDIIATTDLVSHPRTHFKAEVPTLLVSYGRSGNSPESIGAVVAANKLCDEIYHLVMTCNPEGKLAVEGEKQSNTLVLYMPEKANDQSFAMTGSFTSMLLSSVLVPHIENIEDYRRLVEEIASMGIETLAKDNKRLEALANTDFHRIIYLGAGSFHGMAEESALKMLELTAGKVGTLYDTPLGFRHGPKSYIDEKTIVVMYFSNDMYSRKYEHDLLMEMAKDGVAERIIAVCDQVDDVIKEFAHDIFEVGINKLGDVSDEFLNLPYLLVAQVLAFHKSMAFGITPDNPCPSGHVNRVVQGVTLYEIDDKEMK